MQDPVFICQLLTSAVLQATLNIINFMLFSKEKIKSRKQNFFSTENHIPLNYLHQKDHCLPLTVPYFSDSIKMLASEGKITKGKGWSLGLS